MGRRALCLKSAHDHVEHGVGERVVDLRTVVRGTLLGYRHVLDRHFGRREQHRPPVHRQWAAAQCRTLRAGAVHTGDVRRLEAHHLARAELEDAGTRDVRQFVGVRNTDRGPGLRRGEGAQTDPVRQVGLQTAQAALLQALRRQQQMHTERPADTADLHEHLDEVRLGGEEFAELVDHQHQGGNGLQGSTRGPRLLVVVDVGVVARVAQHLLAAVELAADGVAHTVDQGQIVREVGDDGRHVRHLRHTGEGRTALEVREDEVQRLRGVRHGQAQHQGAQQLRLAGTGGAHAQAVRPHALLRGLLEVQHHGPAVLAEPDRNPQPLGQRTRPPGAPGVDGRRVTEVQQVGELQVGEEGLVVVPAGGHPQRGELPGEGLRGLVGEGVGSPLVDHAVPRLQVQCVGSYDDGELAAGSRQLAGDDLEDRDALQALGVGQDGVLRQGDAVEDHHDVRFLRQGRRVGVETRTAGQSGGEQVLQLAGIAVDQPATARAVHRAGRLDVRQPLGPLPVGQLLAAGRDHDEQVLGGVQRGQRAGHGPGGGTYGLRVAADGDVVEGPQRDGHRQVVQGAVDGEETLHRTGGQRLQLLDGGGRGGDQAAGEGLRAEADADLGEVLVTGAPFPHPAALGDQSPQLLGRGVQEVLRVPLRLRRVHSRTSGLRQIAQVVAAHVRQLPLGAPAEADHHGDGHGDRRRDHDHAHDLHERLPVREEEHHRATHAEGRQELHQHAFLVPPRQFGRRLQDDLLRGHFGRQCPRRALHDDVAHCHPFFWPPRESVRRPVSGGRRPPRDPTDFIRDEGTVGCRMFA